MENLGNALFQGATCTNYSANPGSSFLKDTWCGKIKLIFSQNVRAKEGLEACFLDEWSFLNGFWEAEWGKLENSREKPRNPRQFVENMVRNGASFA